MNFQHLVVQEKKGVLEKGYGISKRHWNPTEGTHNGQSWNNFSNKTMIELSLTYRLKQISMSPSRLM